MYFLSHLSQAQLRRLIFHLVLYPRLTIPSFIAMKPLCCLININLHVIYFIFNEIEQLLVMWHLKWWVSIIECGCERVKCKALCWDSLRCPSPTFFHNFSFSSLFVWVLTMDCSQKILRLFLSRLVPMI